MQRNKRVLSAAVAMTGKSLEGRAFSLAAQCFHVGLSVGETACHLSLAALHWLRATNEVQGARSAAPAEAPETSMRIVRGVQRMTAAVKRRVEFVLAFTMRPALASWRTVTQIREGTFSAAYRRTRETLASVLSTALGPATAPEAREDGAARVTRQELEQQAAQAFCVPATDGARARL